MINRLGNALAENIISEHLWILINELKLLINGKSNNQPTNAKQCKKTPIFWRASCSLSRLPTSRFSNFNKTKSEASAKPHGWLSEK